MFGAVQWLYGNPILDGMPIFDTKKDCIKYIELHQQMEKCIAPSITRYIKWTIIRLEKRNITQRCTGQKP